MQSWGVCVLSKGLIFLSCSMQKKLLKTKYIGLEDGTGRFKCGLNLSFSENRMCFVDRKKNTRNFVDAVFKSGNGKHFLLLFAPPRSLNLSSYAILKVRKKS